MDPHQQFLECRNLWYNYQNAENENAGANMESLRISLLQMHVLCGNCLVRITIFNLLNSHYRAHYPQRYAELAPHPMIHPPPELHAAVDGDGHDGDAVDGDGHDGNAVDGDGHDGAAVDGHADVSDESEAEEYEESDDEPESSGEIYHPGSESEEDAANEDVAAEEDAAHEDVAAEEGAAHEDVLHDVEEVEDVDEEAELGPLYWQICRFCNIHFDSRQDWTGHRAEHHLNYSLRTCRHCDDGHVFPSRRSLAAHFRRNHY